MSKWEDWSMGKKALAIIGGTIAGAGFAILFGFVIMWLWNWLMPHIFGLPAISYWEGWGLLILSSILLKGSPKGGNGKEKRKKEALRESMRRGVEECGSEGGGAKEGSAT
jgi:high-affinity Fe2+/Pb2+ permease